MLNPPFESGSASSSSTGFGRTICRPATLAHSWGIGVGLCLAALAAATPPRPEARLPVDPRPNVVFLLSDDQRADTIHALGNPTIRTPNLDRLCRAGTAFRQAYIMGALQGAVCVPSRAMLLGGRSLFRVPEDLAGTETWPERLGRAGYRTFITGKWHNGRDSLLRSFHEGRAVFLGGMTDPIRVPVQDIGPDRTLTPTRTESRFSSELFADQAIEFLRSHPPGQPFCLYVAFTAPHDPRTPPREFRDGYPAGRMPLPGNYLTRHPFDNGELEVRDERLLPWPRQPDAVQRELADYYGMITHLDGQIGRILRALGDAHHRTHSLIVFAGDNGLAIGSHGLLGKQNLYDHSMKVPLVIAGPGIRSNQKIDGLCYLLDVGPTLCEMAGVPPPPGHEAVSLLPALSGKPWAGRPWIFTAYRDVQRAVRDPRWKLIAYPRLNRLQLFDLAQDPLEIHDLANDPRSTQTLERMTALLDAAQREFGDPLSRATRAESQESAPRTGPDGNPSH